MNTRNGDFYLEVMDPANDPDTPPTEIPLDRFVSAYRDGARWTHFYLTGPATSGGALLQLVQQDDQALLGG